MHIQDHSNGNMASEGVEYVVVIDERRSIAGTEKRLHDHLRVLPPAANWYCSQVCDWGYDTRHARWLLIYGAKNGLCIYEFNVADPMATRGVNAKALDQILQRPLRTQFVALMSRGKKDGRVTALRCCRDADGDLRVVCAGEEGAVQIWDPVSLTRIDQHRKHNNTEITAIGVRSELDFNWIVAGDRQGVLSLWQRDTATVYTFSPIPRDAVFAMDVSPFDKRLVAVGYRSGALCIVDVVEKNVRYRLDGHELEVQSVVWAVHPTATTSSVNYLATSSRDRSIKVWAFPHKTDDTEDSQEPYLSARLEVRKPQQASSHSQSTRLWLPLAWTYHEGGKYGIWTGSFEGHVQLFQWNGAPSGTIKPVSTVKNGHNRLLFGIAVLRASSIVPTNVEISDKPAPLLMATISLDRDLRIWCEDLSAKTSNVLTCIERIPAQGGFTYSLDFSSARNMLACGVGDHTIRIWNLSAKQSYGGYHTELVWKGLQSKITSVCWHPMQDHLLAFGTEDGRVGLWDSRSKSTQRLKVKHSGEIHLLQWTVYNENIMVGDSGGGSSFQDAMMALEQAQSMGQSLEDAMAQQVNDTKHSFCDVAVYLWSCDRSGQLYRTNVDKDVSIQIRKDCNAFAWDVSSSVLAVGLSTGKVDIMVSRGSNLTTKNDAGLELHSSIVEHKESVSAVTWYNSDGLSLLASGTKDGELIAFEGVGTASKISRRFDQLPGYGENVVAVFKAHTGGINCVRWCPNAERCLLASCGDDSDVKVWDIAERALRSLYTLHAGRVFSLTWITPTVLSSCGQDQTIRIWDYGDHAAMRDEKKAMRTPSPTPTSNKTQRMVDTAVQRESTDIVETPTVSPTTKARGKKKTAKPESIFSTRTPSWLVHGSRNGETVNHGSSVDSLFTATREGIASERKLLEKDGKIDEAAQLFLLEGRIVDALKLLASHSMLSATWVSYAPMAGQDVWREISTLYATQLKNAGDYKHAALQYLAVSDVKSSAECFIEGEMYPEAIALIKARLGPNHSLLTTTTWQYAIKLEKKKQIDESADLYLSIGSLEASIRAIKILGSSTNIEDAQRAMDVWTMISKTSSHDAKPDDDDRVIPSSIFLSICNCALAHSDFQLASRAISGMLRNRQSSAHPAPLPQESLYILSLITLDIASTLHTGKIEVVAAESAIEPCNDTMQEAQQFMKMLHSVYPTSWISICPPGTPPNDPALTVSTIWFHFLTTCRRNGLWFDGSTLKPDEVIEQLGDVHVLDFLQPSQPSDQKIKEGIPRIRDLIKFSRLILKVLAELMSGYLLSALEVVRDLLSALVSSPVNQLAILRQLFPGGMLNPCTPPLFGELADEETDTRALWADCCLLQCEIVHKYMSELKNADTTISSLDILLKYLTELIEQPNIPESIHAHALDLQNEVNALLKSTPTFSLNDSHTNSGNDTTSEEQQ